MIDHHPTLAKAPPHPEYAYLCLLSDLIAFGDPRKGRNGPTRALFGRQLRFDLADGFPLLTTKRVHFRSVVEELFWMLRGETNVRSLQARGVTIWDEWADAAGDLGPIYGHQWRSWNAWPGERTTRGPDQIAALVHGLRTDPAGRRHLVSAWNVEDLPDMALPPCHFAFQFHVTGYRRLHCQVYQRSADAFLGLPFNIASYALLLHLVAQVTGMIPGQLIFALGDVHLYADHLDAAQQQLTRTADWPFPELDLPPRPEIDDYAPEDVVLKGYQSHPHIAAEVSK